MCLTGEVVGGVLALGHGLSPFDEARTLLATGSRTVELEAHLLEGGVRLVVVGKLGEVDRGVLAEWACR